MIRPLVSLAIPSTDPNCSASDPVSDPTEYSFTRVSFAVGWGCATAETDTTNSNPAACTAARCPRLVIAFAQRAAGASP